MISENDFGIMSETYQGRARMCVSEFVNKFQSSARIQSLSIIGENEIPISFRVSANPPNIQIIEFPIGGKNAGIMRIREKLNTVFPLDIAIVGADDLMRELIVAQSADSVIKQIVAMGLIDRATKQFLKELAENQPALFIIMQRYLMGIETTDKQTIPFNLVTESDDQTFQHIQELTRYL